LSSFLKFEDITNFTDAEQTKKFIIVDFPREETEFDKKLSSDESEGTSVNDCGESHDDK
jgi:hypothetical protein